MASGLLILAGVGFPSEEMEAAGVAKVTPDGEAIELESGNAGENAPTETIPVYREAHIRYFSAGVGAAEREVTYPPFPLKIVFVAGKRAYVSHVAVTIADGKGTVLARIPADRVTGPWLFVDLPPGAYTITGRLRSQPEISAAVQVTADRQRPLILRWEREESNGSP